MSQKQVVQDPVTVAGAIIAVKYDKGILLASDKSIHYGSCFKFANVSHFHQLTNNLIIGGSGEYADFQELVSLLEAIILKEQCQNNGESLTPSELSTYIKRLMYQKRSKMQPLVMRCVVAGISPEDQSNGSRLFLGSINKYGTSYEDDYICTGIAQHLQGLDLAKSVNLDRETVLNTIKENFIAIYARNHSTTGKLEIIDLAIDGIKYMDPVEITPNWDIIPYDE